MALSNAGIKEREIEKALDVFPLRAAERLREKTDNCMENLSARAAKITKENDASKKNWLRVLLIRDGKVEWFDLSTLNTGDKKKEDEVRRQLSDATLILPTELGGLKDGLLDGASDEGVLDVAEETAKDGQRKRQRVMPGDVPHSGLVVKYRLQLNDEEQSEDGVAKYVEYRVEPRDPDALLGGAESTRPVALLDHNADVERFARGIAKRLNLSKELEEALALAGRAHDLGKAREIWQRVAGNAKGLPAIAKSGGYMNGRRLQGFRHELGSLLDAAQFEAIQKHPERDLILHLIAAHHGWARPHFNPDASDRERPTIENDGAVAECARRYARLQRRFGHWGLAWLESLLRCADALASREAEKNGAAK